MRFSLLEEFVELANCLSFSKAAARLHLSQPALSTHINKLEHELGVELIVRDRPIRLTAAGRSFYDNASKILALWSETTKECQTLADSAEHGSLTIKMDYAHEEVKPAFRRMIQSFAKLHPSLEVNITPLESTHANILESQPDSKINVWFFSTSFHQQLEEHQAITGAQAFLVAECDLALWMHPNNPLAKQKRIHVDDVSGMCHPMPMGENHAELVNASKAVFEAHGVELTYRNVLAESMEDYFFAVKEDEVFIFPDYQLDPDRDAFVNRPFSPAIRHNNYLMVKTDEANPALKLFLKYMQEHWETVKL